MRLWPGSGCCRALDGARRHPLSGPRGAGAARGPGQLLGRGAARPAGVWGGWERGAACAGAAGSRPSLGQGRAGGGAGGRSCGCPPSVPVARPACPEEQALGRWSSLRGRPSLSFVKATSPTVLTGGVSALPRQRLLQLPLGTAGQCPRTSSSSSWSSPSPAAWELPTWCLPRPVPSGPVLLSPWPGLFFQLHVSHRANVSMTCLCPRCSFFCCQPILSRFALHSWLPPLCLSRPCTC